MLLHQWNRKVVFTAAHSGGSFYGPFSLAWPGWALQLLMVQRNHCKRRIEGMENTLAEIIDILPTYLWQAVIIFLYTEFHLKIETTNRWRLQVPYADTKFLNGWNMCIMNVMSTHNLDNLDLGPVLIAASPIIHNEIYHIIPASAH